MRSRSSRSGTCHACLPWDIRGATTSVGPRRGQLHDTLAANAATLGGTKQATGARFPRRCGKRTTGAA
eukprot:12530197-Alexandrium_andersonii.AAC.1